MTDFDPHRKEDHPLKFMEHALIPVVLGAMFLTVMGLLILGKIAGH